MRISNNIVALNTQLRLSITEKNVYKTTRKLSSGKKINSSSDDSPGLAISNKMETQIKGIEMASRNSLDGISLLQTAEGALNEVSSILQRMRELAIQSANGTLTGGVSGETDSDREKVNYEIEQLKQEINAISDKTEFNKIKLLKGSLNASLGTTMKLQIGQNKNMEMDVDLPRIDTSTLGIDNMDFLTQQGSHDALKSIDEAISKNSIQRTLFGSYQNRLEYTNRNLDSASENIQLSLSRILDTDMAKEITRNAQFNVISQAATSILAQANQRPQQILQLLN